jgi:hypothetical protein
MAIRLTESQKIYIKRWLVNGSDPAGCPFGFRECNKLCVRLFPGLKEARSLLLTKPCPCKVFLGYYVQAVALKVIDWSYTDLCKERRKQNMSTRNTQGEEEDEEY